MQDSTSIANYELSYLYFFHRVSNLGLDEVNVLCVFHYSYYGKNCIK